MRDDVAAFLLPVFISVGSASFSVRATHRKCYPPSFPVPRNNVGLQTLRIQSTQYLARYLPVRVSKVTGCVISAATGNRSPVSFIWPPRPVNTFGAPKGLSENQPLDSSELGRDSGPVAANNRPKSKRQIRGDSALRPGLVRLSKKDCISSALFFSGRYLGCVYALWSPTRRISVKVDGLIATRAVDLIRACVRNSGEEQGKARASSLIGT